MPRNEGVNISSYDYLCFLDADDFWYKDKLLEQVNFLTKKITYYLHLVIM